MSSAYISPLKAKARRRKRVFAIFGLTIFIAIGLGYWLTRPEKPIIRPTSSPQATSPKSGATPVVNRVVGQDPVISYTSEQALGLIKLTNPAFTGSVPSLKQQTFRYTMTDTDGKSTTVYARLFIPAQSSVNRMPIIGFAPGTTGIDDKCAASVEVPAKRNWANYESHMLSYAAAGYAVVITDYEGMRDASRMHHYMVGVLEGRALLDAVRSINELPTAKGRVDQSSVILAGYSQGGHAAYWADKIATTYAPELTTKAVIGFGPVTDVQQTLTDIVRGANILWFGPYVLYSYADWYSENYSVPAILNPPFAANLSADIAKNCIDTNIGYWGNKDINKVYT
ncbi:hypothetical protein KBC99_01720, partial [Candidatus Saccharibacteria bacterium]|nr:hypothetical protein [Candidatus Saccharibacteria bacterium]